MTQHIIFTAEQANTLNTTGRLEGFKELCEWQPPSEPTCIEKWETWEVSFYSKPDVYSIKELTPTRAVGQVYEAYWAQHTSSRYPVPSDTDTSYKPTTEVYRKAMTHAKIATEPTPIIHEGKLVWTYDLVKE